MGEGQVRGTGVGAKGGASCWMFGTAYDRSKEQGADSRDWRGGRGEQDTRWDQTVQTDSRIIVFN